MLETARRRLRTVLGAGETPERVAAAWAVGVGVGLSPLLGVHTLLAIAAALAFRLNKVDVLLGTMITNPWVLAAYFPACVVAGQWLLGIEVPRVDVPDPHLLLSATAWQEQGAWLKPLLLAWWTGSGIATVVGTAFTYFAVRGAVRRHRLRAHRHGTQRT